MNKHNVTTTATPPPPFIILKRDEYNQLLRRLEAAERQVKELEECRHPILQWRGWANGIYRLHCVICGAYLLSETYLPGTLDVFKRDE